MPTQRITFTEWTPDEPSIVENLSSAASGGTLEFFQSSGSGGGFTNTVNQVVKSA